MPRPRSFLRIVSTVALVIVVFGLIDRLARPDNVIQGKLDDVHIPDLQVIQYEGTKSAEPVANETNLPPKNSINNERLESELQAPERLSEFNHMDKMDIWDTSSLDEVVPDRYISISGKKRPNKVFLTIGIPSIRRPQGAEITYLSTTLKSLITNCSPQDKDNVVILVFLADFDKKYTHNIRSQLRTLYRPYLESGFLQVMEVDPIAYPQLTDLKQNFKDDKKRVTWRAKQCMDFGYMFHYARNLSDYYLQLEDDVLSAPNYVNEIQGFIKAQKKPWVSLQFSVLGFIGKLFHSRDLERFAKFLKLFYQEMPVDWLYPVFAKLLSYPNIPIRKPTLFQHMGKVSSLDLKSKQKLNLLKDKYFKSQTNDVLKKLGSPANPPASFYTTLTTYHSNKPSDAYISDVKKYFWGKEPDMNDTFTVVFEKPHKLKAIQIETGHPEQGNDFIRSADLLVGTAARRRNRQEDFCDGHYKTLDSLVGGSISAINLDKSVTEPIDCIRLLVTGAQIDWVIVNTVAIWVIT